MEQLDIIGPYKINKALGQGGMGVVYLGVHQKTGKQAAVKSVKLPHPGMLQSIRREIYALALIDHPGIIRIIEHGVQAGLPWYAMEYLRGQTLRYYMEQVRSVPAGCSAAPESVNHWWTETISPSSEKEIDNLSAAGLGSADRTMAKVVSAKHA